VKALKRILLTLTHVAAVVVGFAAGVYVLPIWTAAPGPTAAELDPVFASAAYTAEFRRDAPGSDWLHWGEGSVAIGPAAVAFKGRLAPGPDYALYLSPDAVEGPEDFLRLERSMARVGRIDSFDGFVIPLPSGVDPARFAAVVVWCETFHRFITAAPYRVTD
jgi:Electron transfer DM13